MRLAVSIALAAVLVAVEACSSRSEPSGPVSASVIGVRDNLFSPSASVVAVGTSVRWMWEGSNLHSVTFADGPASTVRSTGTFDRQFATAGVFAYQCVVHGVSMSGTVTVQ